MILILLIISVNFFNFAFSSNAFILPEEKTSLSGCVDSVLDLVIRKNDYVIVFDENLSLRHASYSKSNSSWADFDSVPPYISAFVVNINQDDLADTFEKLRDVEHFDTRILFVFIQNAINSSFFKILADYYVFKSIILVENGKNQYSLYTYNPYVHENLHQPNLEYFEFGVCKNGDLEVHQNFTFTLPKLWRNTTVNILYKHFEPYVFEDGVGLDMISTKIIMEKLKFKARTIKAVHDVDIYFGLKNRSIDFCHGCCAEKTPYLYYSTFYYIYDKYTNIMPKAPLKAFYKVMFGVFSHGLWSLIAFLVVFFMIVSFFLNDVTVFFPLIIIIEQTTKLPKLTSSRYFLAVYVLCIYTVSTAFKSKSTAILGEKFYVDELTSLDILENNMLICFNGNSYQTLSKNATKQEQYMNDHFLYLKTQKDCFDRVAFKRDSVALTFVRTFEYLEAKYRYQEDGEPLIYINKSHWEVNLPMRFTKSLPIFDQFNSILVKIKGDFINKSRLSKFEEI
ncbi:unnamed protein product [Brassicogethes aeneus]|uniref:Uncharacterized protein n=1 Tax=Brassicogethes aeneus TaxID=1431903 RepID=A0A9P0FPB6_BRAAE|nr:unnamed protein product [Brassicogethes aeneus]